MEREVAKIRLPVEDNDYKLAYHVGIDDINNKEIFTGDIVKIIPRYNHTFTKSNVGYIKLIRGGFVLVLKDMFEFSPDFETYLPPLVLVDWVYDFEIIGSIYNKDDKRLLNA